MHNILTIDVEDWYMTHDFNFNKKIWNEFEDRVVLSTEKLLEILQAKNIKSTFFILGCVAKRHPELVKKVNDMGHEIGIHGMWHEKLFDFDRESFKQNIIEAKDLIENIISKKIVLHRAPSWSISKNNLWVLEVLDELGFIGDSSIQPFATPLSGIKNGPLEPFHPIINNKVLNIIEFPQTVYKICNIKIPYSGGFYFRFMPYFLIKYFLNQVNKNRNSMLYLHPWEFDICQPIIKAKSHINFIHYYNIKNNNKKFHKLIRDFKFSTFGEVIRDENFNFKGTNIQYLKG